MEEWKRCDGCKLPVQPAWLRCPSCDREISEIDADDEVDRKGMFMCFQYTYVAWLRCPSCAREISDIDADDIVDRKGMCMRCLCVIIVHDAVTVSACVCVVCMRMLIYAICTQHQTHDEVICSLS